MGAGHRHVAVQSDAAIMEEMKQVREQAKKLTALVNLRQSSPRQANRTPIICFCCGRQGHIARYCSSRQQQQQGTSRETSNRCSRESSCSGGQGFIVGKGCGRVSSGAVPTCWE
ncbi:hypothetical protein PoB_000291100 [Plakobranchus ocellatus]|uniref:CCHC-type domain-containing protein n=1 Tax=Plakobranchus ocellatus TaxID=259542 RepID=A0AAV3Y1Z7_9GAST|nr:hypothetical protein PoB_000291100 [Plakobranchus ocellatus]